MNLRGICAQGGNCGGGDGDQAATTAICGGGRVEAFTSFYEVLTQANIDLLDLEIWGVAVTGGHQAGTRPATIMTTGALGNSGLEDWLVGHSGAGTSADPGARDLSQATSAGCLMADADGDALELAAAITPVLDGLFQLETTNIPSTAVFYCGILGFSQLSLPLASGFPSANLDCNLNASVDLVVGPQVVFGGPGSLTWTGVDLSSVSLLGTYLYFQAAMLDLGGLGDTVRTSSGVQATTGLY